MAPLALLVALAAVGYVVSSATNEDAPSGSSQPKDSGDEKTSTGAKTSTGEARTTPTSQPRTYTVKSGDTLGTIAEQTGVSVAELQELNPDLDPQSLTVGDKIRLRR
jgi:teichoic acid transport system ATP-binding protein